MKELVTVIIPTYNRLEELKNAINSVLKQSYTNLEIIIIDNNSTDGTIEYLKKFLSKNKKIQYYINFMKGANYSRNLGIEKAKGKYLAFLDDDDTWEINKIEKQVIILEKYNEVGLCYTGKKIKDKKLDISYNSFSKGNNIYIENFIGTTSSVMIRKEILEKSGLFDIKLPALQDYDLWIRILKYTKYYEIREPLTTYYISSNNNQITNSLQNYKKGIKFLDNKYSDDIYYIKYIKERNNKREKELIYRSIREKEYLPLKNIKKIKNKFLYLILKNLDFKILLNIKRWMRFNGK